MPFAEGFGFPPRLSGLTSPLMGSDDPADTKTAMPSARRVAGIIIAAAVVGVLLSLLKGQGGGARLTFGNLSAPWLLMGFVAGTRFRQALRAAAAGVLATTAAMVGFYVQQSPLWDLSASSLRFFGDPGFMWRYIVVAHEVYFIAALITGTAFGLLGWLCSRREWRVAAIAMALMFVGEPLAWAAFAPLVHAPVPASSYWIWAAELAGGVAACVLIVRARRLSSFAKTPLERT